MRKLLLQIMFILFALPGISQMYVYVDGYVTDSATGYAISNHPVYIVSDSSGGFIYYNTVYTNANGWYMDTIPSTVGTGSLYVSTYDCNQTLHQVTVNYDQSNVSFSVNFNICNSAPPCQALFYFSVYPTGLVSFFDYSSGNPTSWFWNFGDGGTSTQQNPVHQYNATGYYTATLTITNSSTGCTSTSSNYFYVSMNGGGGCQAYYYAYPDSSSMNTYFFYDQSQGTNLSWQWDFGDPSSGANNTSTLQNATHIFSGPGVYNVCLTIQGDSSCTDTYCQTIYINSGGGCYSYFFTYPDPANERTVNFVNQSSGNITTWTYTFGDGTSETITYPGNPNISHTYQGNAQIYYACLYVSSGDSTCFDSYCDTVFVGNNIGCEADFLYYSAGINTIQFLNYSTSSTGPWNWSFGDGTTSNEKDPLHLYPSPGAYQTTLTIGTPGSNCYDSESMLVYVIDSTATGCQASFSVQPDSMSVPPYTYHFFDQSSGNITSWLWSFGDGTTSGEQNPYHSFQPGTYFICLTIHGADSSCYDVTCDTLVVGNNAGCQAYFTYELNPATGTNTVQFTDLSTGYPTGWYWSFGDSTYSFDQNPSHDFQVPGSYYVCLTITSGTCTDTYCSEVIVENSTQYHQVYGQVYEANTLLGNGYALIFSIDSVNYQPYVAVCPIDSVGLYYFDQVPDGNFMVYAIPLDYNGYLPTYYGDVLNWSDATVISLGQEANPYDIHLILGTNMPEGEGTVSGQINVTGLKSTYLDKMVMLLMNESGEVIYYDPVSTSGTFDFSNMAYGTYYLHAEMTGITTENVKVVLSADQPHADVVMTFNGNSVLGIENGKSPVESMLVYPNPAHDNLSVSLTLSASSAVHIEVSDIRGEVVLIENRSLTAGSQVISIPATRLSPGFYTLSVTTENGFRLVRKLMIAR